MEKALQVHPNNRWQMAAEFKNELLKAQSGRFNFSFGIDQSSPQKSKKELEKSPPGVIARGVETKQVERKAKVKEEARPAEKKAPRQKVKVDRGGCLALVGLMAFILILAGAVFSLLNPAFTKNLISFIF